MLVIGERINSSRKGIDPALREKDAEFIVKEARNQVDAGAHVIDVNAATLMDKEVEPLTWAIQMIQGSLDVPICIDTPNPRAVEKVLPLYNGKAMVNSITAETDRYVKLIGFIQQYKPNVVGLCMDDRGMPDSAEDRIRIASDLIGNLTKDGVPLGDIYIDPVVTPVSIMSFGQQPIVWRGMPLPGVSGLWSLRKNWEGRNEPVRLVPMEISTIGGCLY